ncbi:hypothetical protein [Kibdelosporangium philippinense]|uniref:hypothetical protein n=1 Tax=Kibdelosporangium philippinense TaxID=211113 RepID=UPI003614149B
MPASYSWSVICLALMSSQRIAKCAYVRTRDEITSKPRPVKEIKQRYANLVAQVVLRTMRDVFDLHPAGVINEVAINGHVSTRNKATGQPERPCLVSVSATPQRARLPAPMGP